MKVAAIALSSFLHDDIRGVENQVIEPWIDESVAGDLERAGLVRIKMVPRFANKMMPAPENKDADRATLYQAAVRNGVDAGKAPAAGQDQLSSSLPAAPVSPSTTLHLPKRGAEKRQKDTQ